VAFSVMYLEIDEESRESKERGKKQHIDNLTLCHWKKRGFKQFFVTFTIDLLLTGKEI
jgi:hypothetical protein